MLVHNATILLIRIPLPEINYYEWMEDPNCATHVYPFIYLFSTPLMPLVPREPELIPGDSRHKAGYTLHKMPVFYKTQLHTMEDTGVPGGNPRG